MMRQQAWIARGCLGQAARVVASMLVVAYVTGLRHRTLMADSLGVARHDNGRKFLIPGSAIKSGRPQVVYLNQAAFQITLPRFEAPGESWFSSGRIIHRQLWTMLHRLQNLAAIPEKDHFGLHPIRKTTATVLAGDPVQRRHSPWGTPQTT